MLWCLSYKENKMPLFEKLIPIFVVKEHEKATVLYATIYFFSHKYRIFNTNLEL